MAMGRHKSKQQDLFVPLDQLDAPPMRPFYARLDALLREHQFDAFVEARCAEFYAPVIGRKSLPPGVYFRAYMIGYFERIESERGIAWRLADSITLRRFVGLEIAEATPDHSTLSVIRRRLPLAVHDAVFTKVLEILALANLLKGKTLGLDATLLAANASLKGLRQKVDGKSYRQYVTSLMAADPDAPKDPDGPTPEQIARYDRKRRKSLSNKDWHNPHNPQARIAKLKDGRTHFAEKCEHAIDFASGAVVGLTIQPADTGDTTSIYATVRDAIAHLDAIQDALQIVTDPVAAKPSGVPLDASPGSACGEPTVSDRRELVADKGYHSNDTCKTLSSSDLGLTTYLSEPARGPRNWHGKDAERAAVEGNGQRVASEPGKRLMRRRGELVERAFAHYLDHGRMRRVHLRGHENIAKRLLIHTAGFNLGILMRHVMGAGTPQALAALRKRGRQGQNHDSASRFFVAGAPDRRETALRPRADSLRLAPSPVVTPTPTPRSAPSLAA